MPSSTAVRKAWTKPKPRRGWLGSARTRAERALLLEFLEHFRNPLVLVLLAASAIAGFLGDVRGFVVIGAIVLMSVGGQQG